MGPMYMTREGYRKLEQELNHLIKVKRKDMAARLEVARAFGDLRENAEFHALKEEQVFLEAKIGEISAKLASTQIIDNMDIPSDKAYVGAKVRLHDMTADEQIQYILVSDAEADIMENKLSVSSPVGKALLGRAVDEVVEIQVPIGILKYRILEITR